MNVSGLSIMTRKMLVVRGFGAEAWSQFYRSVATSHGCFGSLVTADTHVPLPAFLGFHDALMARFFKEDDASYMKLGREASRWALRDGRLNTLLDAGDFESVVASLPKFHRQYFKEAATWSEASVTPEGVSFKVHDLPEWHPYFEHFIVGYIAEILEMFCANPIRALRVEGGSGNHYHYLFHGSPSHEESEPLPVSTRRPPPLSRVAQELSDRELEVLLLIARGRTNEEIGAVLGISKKTAQHHAAHAYRKLGVSCRVEATIWLMERGFIGN